MTNKKTKAELIVALEQAQQRIAALEANIQHLLGRQGTEEQAQPSEMVLELILETSPIAIGISRVDDGKIIFVNKAFEALYGYSREALLGKTTAELNLWAIAADRQRFIERLITDGFVDNFESIAHACSGERRNVLLTGRSVNIQGELCLMAQITDITTHKETENRLRKSEHRLHEAQRIARIGTWEWNLLTGETTWSPEVYTIHGLTQDAPTLTAETVMNFLHPDDREMASKAIAQAIGEGKPADLEYRIFRPDGSMRFVHVMGEVVEFDTDGKPTLMIGTNQDITERKQIENALRESEDKFRKAFITSPDAVNINRLEDGLYVAVNQGFTNITGYSEAEVIGKTSLEIEIWENVEDRKRLVEGLRRDGFVDNLEARFRKKDGQLVYGLMSANIIMLGDVPHSLNITRDITERKEAEEKIRESMAQYRYLFENNPLPMWAYDLETLKFLTVNDAAISKYGYSRKEFLQMTINDIRPAEDLHRLKENLSQPRMVMEFSSGWRHTLKDGGIIEVEIASHTVDVVGQHAALVVALDVTERKRAEENLQALNAELEMRVEKRTEELQMANAELQYAMRAKDSFLANMSHELRTPLNGILGMAEILLDGYRGPLNEHQLKFVNGIEASGRHLLSLINDILDLSKIEADKMDLIYDPVVVSEMCQASLAFVKQPAAKKNIDLVFHPWEEEIMLQADGRRVKQILVNLLSNAVKFTPEGGSVTLAARLDRAAKEVEFSVTDNGIGISAEDQKHLFEPFTQVDNSLTRKYEGTGLGLALVKRLVDLHGGRVTLESTVGVGSRFTVFLPWQRPTPAPEGFDVPPASLPESDPVETADPQSKVTVLLVEDNRINSLAMGDYLEAKGFDVRYAHDGLEALVKAAECPPHLFLMDVQMPGMDGLEATRRLRTDARFATTPIIALTAHTMPGDAEACLAAGANDYLGKPVEMAKIVQMIRKWLDN